jgi:2-polyprenyl-3-methyl-5-hydroxy-6-metoxy-1,4-benzoquinol methylase
LTSVWLTPVRRRGVEILDDPTVSPAVRERSMTDVARSNALFGGARAVLLALGDVLPTLPSSAVLLDVGTGMADIPVRVRIAAAWAHVSLTTIGVDQSAVLLSRAGARLDAVVVGDARCIPVADRSVDVVTCSQLLHHFEAEEARRAILELHRVSRRWIVISDLSRSWLAAAAFWCASILLRFHPVTRHDGVMSIFRGFTADELAQLVYDATGIRPRIRGGAFWRLSATWARD